MKVNILIVLFVIALISLKSCTSIKVTDNEVIIYDTMVKKDMDLKLSISLQKGKSYYYPTYVIWEEDMYGNYVRTIFVTKSYATGIFCHKMISDTVWMKIPGPSNQPAALPYWTHKKGLIDNTYLIPTPEHPFIDAYTSATPKKDFKFLTKSSTCNYPYRILLEVNQPWDWNKFWTNNMFPLSNPYKHSAQPSMIYAVTINVTDSLFYMNPIGYGDPTGETGKLFTNLSTITTARKIFNSLKIQLKK